ncbi:MAG: hypothetical protein HZA54_11015 [Planctomycetes bacterium]|nr:hypothetical protein [Planctomycetota bacterium]
MALVAQASSPAPKGHATRAHSKAPSWLNRVCSLRGRARIDNTVGTDRAAPGDSASPSSLPCAGPFACRVCGLPLLPDRMAVAGLGLCRGCLTPRNPAPPSRFGEGYPPTWWGAAIGGALLAALLAGGGLGFMVELGLRAAGLSFRASLLGVAAGALAFSVRLARIQAALDRRWKRQFATRLGLAHLPPACLALAVMLNHRGEPTQDDLVLLAETEEALVFFSVEHGMSVLPLAQISSPPVPDGFMSAWWARLGLADGSCRWIIIREGGDGAWGRRVATGEFMYRVFARRRLTYWQETIGRQAHALTGFRVGSIPDRQGDLWTLGQGLDAGAERAALEEAGRNLVGSALWLLLLNRGWTPVAPPGGPLLAKGDRRFDMRELPAMLAAGMKSPDAWRRFWESESLADVDLGEFARSFTRT